MAADRGVPVKPKGPPPVPRKKRRREPLDWMLWAIVLLVFAGLAWLYLIVGRGP